MEQKSSLPNVPLSRGQYWKFALFVTILAAIVTAWFTRPLLSQLGTHIPGREGDALEHLWIIWWFDQSLFNLGQLPSTLDIINYPATLQQPIFTAGFWARAVSLPVVRLFDPGVAYNLHLFVSYILSWLFMSLLCLELTGSRKAAVIGGAVFTFFTNRTMHVFYGHWTTVLTYFVPLLVLSMWLVIKRPSIKHIIFLVTALVMSATIDLPPLAYFTIPVVTAVFIFIVIATRNKTVSIRALRYLGLSFGVAAIILLPAMWPLLSNVFTSDLDWFQASGVATFSVDLLSPVFPPPGHFVTEIWPGLQTLSNAIYSFDMGASMTESVVYIGWVTIVLAGLGLIWGWRKEQGIQLWFLLAGVSAFLGLGPILRVGGKIISLGEQRVILPYFLLMKTPAFSWGRTPARFYFAVMFAVAILAAYGLKYLLARIQSKKIGHVVTAVVLFLVLGDSTFFKEWPMIDLSVPDFYSEMAGDSRAVAVLDIPALDYDAAKYHLLYQMTHGHALVGGYSYRWRPDVVQTITRFEALAKPGGDPTQLASSGISYIILHRRYLSPDELDEITKYLTAELAPPIYQDDQIIAFFVPNASEIAPLPLYIAAQ